MLCGSWRQCQQSLLSRKWFVAIKFLPVRAQWGSLGGKLLSQDPWMGEALGSAACAPLEQGWGRRACPSPSRNCPGVGMCNSLPPQPCHAVFHLARNVFAAHQPTPVLGAARPCMAGHVPAPGILSHPHNTAPGAKKIPPCRALCGDVKACPEPSKYRCAEGRLCSPRAGRLRSWGCPKRGSAQGWRVFRG